VEEITKGQKKRLGVLIEIDSSRDEIEDSFTVAGTDTKSGVYVESTDILEK
jgi:hypothetical protein